MRVTFCHAQQGDSLMAMISKTIVKMVVQFPTDIVKYWIRLMLQKRVVNQSENQSIEQPDF